MIDLFAHLWSRLDYQYVSLIRCGVATTAALLLGWDLIAGSRSTSHHRRWRDWLLGTLACIAFLAWWDFGHFHYPAYVQVHEHYHYYLGSKYFPELGYTRLYQCTAVADVEAGLGQQVANRWITDLSTNEFERGRDIVRDPNACKSHFTAERWKMFEQDVAWFRSHRTVEEWNVAQSDHGYNGTPVWGIAGTLLTRSGQASDQNILRLALLDPVLIAVMWAFVCWAFGWRTMCVAVIWWGTNYLSRYFWTGGAFLRADWLAFAVIGVCLMKRGRPAAGGAALTYATLLRIFPGAIIAGLVLKAAMTMWRNRTLRLEPAHRSFAIGSVSAAVVLIALSFIVVGRGVAGGVAAWEGFAANSRKHLATPLTNNMGLKTVVSFDPKTRAVMLGSFWLDKPWDTWTTARHRVFEQRQPIFWTLVVAFGVLLAVAVNEQDDWVALVLGATLIPVATELTCYYYAILVLFALLWSKSEWSGASLCALAAVSSIVPAVLQSDDDVYTLLSVLVLLYVMAITVRMMRVHSVTAANILRDSMEVSVSVQDAP